MLVSVTLQYAPPSYTAALAAGPSSDRFALLDLYGCSALIAASPPGTLLAGSCKAVTRWLGDNAAEYWKMQIPTCPGDRATARRWREGVRARRVNGLPFQRPRQQERRSAHSAHSARGTNGLMGAEDAIPRFLLPAGRRRAEVAVQGPLPNKPGGADELGNPASDSLLDLSP
ncbi:hypothetical protein FDECE_15024 [Fusarium decemcellulare]|nr:hypothetical protein FDECE_15024 [Fusarium decemcellulare]